MELQNTLLILKRRKWIFLSIVALVLGGFLLIARTEPRLHTADADLFVARSELRSLMGHSNFSAAQPAFLFQAQTALLTRPEVFEEAAKRLGGKAPLRARRERLRELVQISSEEKEHSMRLAATGEDPKEVLDSVRAVAEAIQAHSKALAQSEYKEAEQILVEQTEQNRLAIAEKQRRLEELKRGFKEHTGFEIGFGGFERESDRRVAEIEALEKRLKEILASRAILVQKIERFGARAEDGSVDVSRVPLAIDLSPSLDELRKRIVESRVLYAEILKRFTERHPEAEQARAELESLNAQVGDALKERLADLTTEEEFIRARIEEAKRSLESLATVRAEFLREQRALDLLHEKQSWFARTLAELRLEKSFQSGSVRLVSLPEEAQPIPSATRQAFPFIVVLAVALGLVMAYLSEYLDDTVRSDYQVNRYLNLDVLGHFPYIGEEEKRLIAGLTPSHPLVEIFNRAASRVMAATKDRKESQVLLVTSPCQDEGKTTITANLAAAFAHLGHRVVLIDADLRKPRIHQVFGLSNQAGLSTYLTGRQEARQVLQEIVEGPAAEAAPPAERILETLFQETSIPNLRVITAGPVTPNPIRSLESPRFAELLGRLRGIADWILVDSPPLQVAADASRISARADGSLLVMVSGETRRQEASWAKHFLEETGTPVLGAILNKMRPDTAGYSYYYYYGYDRYGYERRDLRERA